jgi:methyl-accepting chemotaxis protein
MMEESLRQKIEVLQKIEKENLEQRKLLENEEGFDEESFDKTLTRKSELIGQVEKLNDGFESLFDRVRDELGDNKEKYRKEISTLQDLIRQITDLSNSIETGENRNRLLADVHFKSSRDRINQSRRSSSAALNYYLTMNKSNVTPPQFYDSKN